MRRRRGAARGRHLAGAKRGIRKERILRRVLELTRPTVLYDPDCGFCRATLWGILAWDRAGRLRATAIGSPEADRLLAGMPAEQRWASWHIVDPYGSVSSAGAGFAPLLRRLPGGRPLARLAERFPAAAERAYRLAADNRSLLGRAVPEAVKHRAECAIARREA